MRSRARRAAARPRGRRRAGADDRGALPLGRRRGARDALRFEAGTVLRVGALSTVAWTSAGPCWGSCCRSAASPAGAERSSCAPECRSGAARPGRDALRALRLPDGLAGRALRGVRRAPARLRLRALRGRLRGRRARRSSRRGRSAGSGGSPALAAELVAETVPRPPVDALAFVPGEGDRVGWRGANPAQELACALAGRWALPVVRAPRPPPSVRPQRGLTRAERRANIRAAFRADASLAEGGRAGRRRLHDRRDRGAAATRATAGRRPGSPRRHLRAGRPRLTGPPAACISSA